ncbi:hypothetical protein PR048_002257 [Dryococelus australis]|uniref:Uncharacterized protein n=1 Tax=Dryococelus australis TaxID=614101 RepID=A0ABQ9IJP2_9NEOP|nr:hypothetical protein PR048_002257 [Dryococelus australis]
MMPRGEPQLGPTENIKGEGVDTGAKRQLSNLHSTALQRKQARLARRSDERLEVRRGDNGRSDARTALVMASAVLQTSGCASSGLLPEIEDRMFEERRICCRVVLLSIRYRLFRDGLQQTSEHEYCVGPHLARQRAAISHCTDSTRGRNTCGEMLTHSVLIVTHIPLLSVGTGSWLEEVLGKEWEGIVYSLCYGPTPACALKDFGKPRKTEIRLAGPEIEPGCESNHSPPTEASRVRFLVRSLLHFRMWESCRTMPLVGGFSRGSPVSPSFSFRRRSMPRFAHSRAAQIRGSIRSAFITPPDYIHGLKRNGLFDDGKFQYARDSSINESGQKGKGLCALVRLWSRLTGWTMIQPPSDSSLPRLETVVKVTWVKQTDVPTSRRDEASTCRAEVVSEEARSTCRPQSRPCACQVRLALTARHRAALRSPVRACCADMATSRESRLAANIA